MKNSSAAAIVLLLFAFGLVAYFTFQDEPAPNTIETQELEASVAVQPSEPTVHEMILDGAKEYGPKAISAVKDHRQKQDSIRSVNREELYGIQIGLAKSNEKDAFDAYKALSGKSESIKIFKKSKSEYLIVKFDGSSKEEIEDSINDLTTTLNEKNLKVFDLMNLCGKRKKIKVESDKINKESVPCLICD